MLVGRQFRTAAVSVRLSAQERCCAEDQKDFEFSLDVTTARDHDPLADQGRKSGKNDRVAKLRGGCEDRKLRVGTTKREGTARENLTKKGGVKRYTR